MIKLEPTPRGFLRGEFFDLYDASCSIQESSLAGPPALWLGCDGNRMNLTRGMVKDLLPLLQCFVRHGGLLEEDEDG